MNITNLEMTQASMELFGCLICLMVVLIIFMNGYKKKSLRMFIHICVTAAVLFLMEGCAYIFGGNTGTFNVLMTVVSNYIVFVANFLLLGFFMQYLYKLLEEKGKDENRIFLRIALVCRVCVYGILFLNIYTKWMYFFDQDNNYHRNTGWYVYTALALVTIILFLIVIIKNRKILGKDYFISLIICGTIPVITAIFQSFIYGISINSIGVGITIIIMLFVYLRSWGKDENEDISQKQKGRKILEIIVLFVIMAFSMSASIISCVMSIDRISKENFEQDGKIIAHMIGDSIRSDMLRPITVSETMARDYILKLYINRDNGDLEENIETDMATYLNSIKQGFDYQSAFCATEKNRRYYTNNGFGRYLDTGDYGNDLWYTEFIDSKKQYELNVNNDWEREDNGLSLFINRRVESESGKLIGVCGVGVDVTQLRSKIEEYENRYHVKVNLTDSKGLVMIDSNIDRMKEIYIDNSYFYNVNSDEFYYEDLGKEQRLTKYMDDLGWYLVVHQDNVEKLSAGKITAPSIVIFVVGLLMMGVVFMVISIKEQKASRELEQRNKMSITDEMTGLFNRRAYEEDIKKIKEKNLSSDYTIIMMDVNGLKAVNDKIGHNAGDELIIASANCMQTTFSEFGRVYRTGGDEFIAMLQISKNQLTDALKTFDHIVSNWKGLFIDELAISKGVVICRDHSELDFKEQMELADKLMYQDKDAYYKKTGRDRRKAR